MGGGAWLVRTSSTLVLPGGRRAPTSDEELTVAEVFMLPPRSVVTVQAEPEVGCLACLSMSGARLGALAVPDTALAFHELKQPLAAACGLCPAQVQFITAEGEILNQASGNVAELFGLREQTGTVAP